MTYDNDTRALVTVTLADALDVWTDRATHEHIDVLHSAIKDAHAALTRAMKRKDADAMIGASQRLAGYADKQHRLIAHLGNRS
jgi:hypothetical protein